MKTTIEIADPLLRKAKLRAVQDGTTLRAVMERALEKHLGDAPALQPFKLVIKPFQGTGVRPGYEMLNREKINTIAYDEEDRFK